MEDEEEEKKSNAAVCAKALSFSLTFTKRKRFPLKETKEHLIMLCVRYLFNDSVCDCDNVFLSSSELYAFPFPENEEAQGQLRFSNSRATWAKAKKAAEQYYKLE